MEECEVIWPLSTVLRRMNRERCDSTSCPARNNCNWPRMIEVTADISLMNNHESTYHHSRIRLLSAVAAVPGRVGVKDDTDLALLGH